MEIKAFGDAALLIEFKNEISLEVHETLIRLYVNLTNASLDGISYIIPAYNSICVGYKKEHYSFSTLKNKIELISFRKPLLNQSKNKTLYIPVCYELGADFKEICEETELRKETIISLHTQKYFTVFMQGFVPGFAYMGVLPEALKCSRKTNPRTQVAKGSVAIAGVQTAIYPGNTPGGWQIIGRTPIPLLDSSAEDPFLFKTGWKVKFHAINQDEFNVLDRKVLAGNFKWSELYG